MKKKRDKTAVFNQMMDDMMNEYNGSEMLEECMSFDVNVSKRIPLRYRIIALGFISHYSLEQLNDKLKAEGCARLYSRSMWEASLIYAFLNKMSYHKWQKLEEECVRIRQMQELENPYFRDNKITMAELKRYLEGNSRREDQQLATEHMTRVMEQKIQEAAAGKADFASFLQNNIRSFSLVREKARYYFCKYLYYDLLTRIENYISACKTGIGVEESLSELTLFKGISSFRSQKLTAEDREKFLMQAGISSGEIFDAFNYFYFEYVSLDWMEVLLEYFGEIRHLPPKQKKRLADALRKYNSQYADMTDEQILRDKMEEMEKKEAQLDEIYSLDGTNRGYQRNRSGEKAVRDYIKGTLDIDRTTLLCFLMFFGSDARLPREMAITRERLDTILLECGYAALIESDDFDYFVIHYLESDDPVDFLMNEVTECALRGENFYLYRMYRYSRSADKDFQKLMGV